DAFDPRGELFRQRDIARCNFLTELLPRSFWSLLYAFKRSMFVPFATIPDRGAVPGEPHDTGQVGGGPVSSGIKVGKDERRWVRPQTMQARSCDPLWAKDSERR